MARVRVQLTEADFELNHNDLNDIGSTGARNLVRKRSPVGTRRVGDFDTTDRSAIERPNGTDPVQLRGFQKEFIKHATHEDIDTAALSLPRGNGKSWLAGYLITRILDPFDPLFRQGTESILCAASLEQARIVFRFARSTFEKYKEYRFQDSTNTVGITHVPTNTRLRCIGSNGKTALGMVRCPWVFADEPGAWEHTGGTLLYDAIEIAKGKPGSPLKAIYIGTLAPATGGWWHDLIEKGSNDTTYVKVLQGDPKKWEDWNEIKRVNPLIHIDKNFAKRLKTERQAARSDSRLKARWFSYRLNIPTPDESVMLLTTDDWKRVCSREVTEKDGAPIWGIDLGHSRAFSSCVAIYPSGRVEAIAICPGIPSIEAQEKRDRVPKNVYRSLVKQGKLIVADGLRVPQPNILYNTALQAFGPPRRIVCDMFKLPQLKDVVKGAYPINTRRTLWSYSTEDIGSTRKLSLDGPLNVEVESRGLITASLAAAMVKNDESGNTRLVKNGTNNQSRDDVAAALVLACGEYHRIIRKPPRSSGMKYGGLVG